MNESRDIGDSRFDSWLDEVEEIGFAYYMELDLSRDVWRTHFDMGLTPAQAFKESGREG